MSDANRHQNEDRLIDPALLLAAYRGGIFPMAEHRNDPEIMWVEPRERAILPLDGLHVSRSLAKLLKQDRYAVTCNRAFGRVIEACAAPRRGPAGLPDDSWISRRIEGSYRLLHRLGHAHSIECWRDGALVGGLYGVGFDGVFCGESMFARADNASKVALCWLVAAMRRAGMRLLDCQFMTIHLASLGARSMPQQDYLERLRNASAPAADPARFRPLPEGYESLVSGVSSPGKAIAQSLTQTS